MAHLVQTDEGAGEDDELKQWIAKNKLSSAQQSLIENQVSLTELSELEPNDAKEYAKGVLGLDAIESIRFVKAVQSLSNPPTKSTDSAPKQVVRVVLTEQEDQAINKILAKKRQINEDINSRENDINTLKKTAKSNDNEINTLTKEFINALRISMGKLIEQSNLETNKKNDILSHHVDTLKMYVQSLNDANSQIDALLNDPNVDKLKRKAKILNISESVLDTNIDNIDVMAKVEVEIRKQQVLDFIHQIGTIISYNYPDKPRLSVTDITWSSATIQFDNIKSPYEGVLELTVGSPDDDETKTDYNWKQICSIKNEDSYSITNLESNTSHAVRAKYKAHRGFGAYCRPILFQTKQLPTLDSSILTRSEVSTFLSLLSNNGKTLGSKTWQLVYRGQRDGINRTTFMNMCYNVSNILVIIHNSTDNVFGGFTSTGWRTGTRYTKDEHAFLFTIRSSNNYAPAIANILPNKAESAMQWQNTSHPHYCMWGSGTDVWIHGTENSVRVNDPSTFYPFPEGKNYMSSGVYKTNINNIEVFQVLDK
eukprot:184345_1